LLLNLPDVLFPRSIRRALARAKARICHALGALLTAISIVLVPLFLFLIGQLVSDLTDGMGLQKKERGLIFALAFLLSLPIALLPGWLALRLSLTWSRNLPVKCSCGWSGICKVKQN
jgi:hypothetical protein